MSKKFERYFGKNLARKFYVAALALVVIGIIIAFVYWAGYGIPIAAVGVVIFFIASVFQVSDRDIDGHVNETFESYGRKIDGRAFGKGTLDARNFSMFKGFICEGEKNRFKSGGDGKLRTSKFYITAISAEKGDVKIFSTVYDILSDETPVDRWIYTKGADGIEFSKEPTEFPKGNFKCLLKVTKNGESEELEFYLPDDALADKLIDKIK